MNANRSNTIRRMIHGKGGFAGLHSTGLLFCVPGPVGAQDSCARMRAPTTLALVKALANRKSDDVTAAIVNLAKTPVFAKPSDPVRGRRPIRTSYAIRYTDRQLQRRARDLFKTIERATWWHTDANPRPQGHAIPLSTLAGSIRSLLALARAFPEWREPGHKLAIEMGDAIIATSRTTGFPATVLAPTHRDQRGKPFFRGALRHLLKDCQALRQAIRGGWFISPTTPEMHYAETGQTGEAMLRLARDTGKKRFLDWARGASRWLTIRPIAAYFRGNSLVAGFDAELFILTAETTYLARAMDWAISGVMLAFAPLERANNYSITLRANTHSFIQHLPLGDLADITRSLALLSTAIATAPVGTLNVDDAQRVYQATRTAYALFQKRAIKNRRLQYPALLIEISIDIERAQRAGAPLDGPDPDALKHALAHGADRLKRYIALPGGAKGRLLEKLMTRGWKGAHRVSKWKENATNHSVTVQ